MPGENPKEHQPNDRGYPNSHGYAWTRRLARHRDGFYALRRASAIRADARRSEIFELALEEHAALSAVDLCKLAPGNLRHAIGEMTCVKQLFARFEPDVKDAVNALGKDTHISPDEIKAIVWKLHSEAFTVRMS
jgi:hypothetical protein